MDDAIKISGLNKSFKEIKAVQDLSFRIKKGELFAFLGVNGAGKSTTISIICGILPKDGGKVYINGEDAEKDFRAIKNQLGVVFQNSVLDSQLSLADNLECRAALYGITGKRYKQHLSEISDMLQLGDILRRPVGKLSGGQRRRGDIARALIHRPDILILDEPTTGLDPQTRKLIWDAIRIMRGKMTVLLTTHYMEEAADADYVVIIDSGKIAAEGTPVALKNKYTGDFITIYGANEDSVAALHLPYVKIRDGFRVEVSNTAEATRIITEHSSLFTDYEITKGKMDDVFLAVTGKNITEAGAIK